MNQTLRFLILLAVVFVGSKNASASIQLSGSVVDDRPSLVYEPSTGDLSVEGGGHVMTTIEIVSDSGLFQKCFQPPGLFDVCSASKIFMLDPNGFESLLFEGALATELPPDLIRDDLTVAGSFLVGGGLSSDQEWGVRIDLVYVPEPGLYGWCLLAGVAIGARRRK